MTPEILIGLGGLVLAVISAAASYVGAAAAMRVHLQYLRRDVDDARRSVRAAHWRLDEINAPPARSADR